MSTLQKFIESGQSATDFVADIAQIDESGLSRILQLFNEAPAFAVITAFRVNLDLKTNRKRNEALFKALNGPIDAENKFRSGPQKLLGWWPEAPDGSELFFDSRGRVESIKLRDGRVIDGKSPEAQKILTTAQEESFFVPMPEAVAWEDFRRFIELAVRKSGQDAAIISRGRTLFFIDRKGTLSKFASNISVGKMGVAYSAARNKPGVTFTFESVEL